MYFLQFISSISKLIYIALTQLKKTESWGKQYLQQLEKTYEGEFEPALIAKVAKYQSIQLHFVANTFSSLFNRKNNKAEIQRNIQYFLMTVLYDELTDDQQMDEKRVFEAAKKLTRADWQFYDQARPKKVGGKLQITEIGLDKDRKTKKIKDSCIFLNRVGYEAPGYTGSFGCALHHLALKEQVHFVDTKPDICWQLPIRRSWETREYGDEEITVVVIGEYTRTAWGEGGADFDWYCTSNSEAHVGRVPVYQSSEVELTKMMGPKGYAELVKLCDSRMAAISATRKAQKKRELPLFVIHPATKAVQEGR